MTKLQAAVNGVRPPPCEAPVRCAHYKACTNERQACDAFWRYVVAGGHRPIVRKPWEVPSAGPYRRVFKERDEEDGERGT